MGVGHFTKLANMVVMAVPVGEPTLPMLQVGARYSKKMDSGSIRQLICTRTYKHEPDKGCKRLQLWAGELSSCLCSSAGRTGSSTGGGIRQMYWVFSDSFISCNVKVGRLSWLPTSVYEDDERTTIDEVVSEYTRLVFQTDVGLRRRRRRAGLQLS